jgi:hypothetical protein
MLSVPHCIRTEEITSEDGKRRIFVVVCDIPLKASADGYNNDAALALHKAASDYVFRKKDPHAPPFTGIAFTWESTDA